MPSEASNNSLTTGGAGFAGRRVALGVSGGIAAYKAVEVLRGLQRAGCEVRVGMTKRACEFVTPLTFRALSGAHVVVDDYAPDNPDPIAHITFSQSVELFVVAPATANVIAKFANGVADDFLTSTYLASNAPVLVAPAMNTTMLLHPATQRNLARLRADGVRIVEPDAGEMACGTIGPGRLSEPQQIVEAALGMLRESAGRLRDLAGERVLVTAGATREELDPVRFISNHSSGRMGFAVAEAALARGAEVTVVAGATTARPPAGARTVRAFSAEEMREAVMREVAGSTVFIAAAAVADYRPAARDSQKMKKTGSSLTLTLEPTPDILAEVSRTRRETACSSSASPPRPSASSRTHATSSRARTSTPSSPTTSRRTAPASTPTRTSSRSSRATANSPPRSRSCPNSTPHTASSTKSCDSDARRPKFSKNGSRA